MRMHALEVCEQDASVKSMAVVDTSVLDHGIRDGDLVVPRKVTTATRASLLVWHRRHPAADVALCGGSVRVNSSVVS
jgi:hypothetical protein